MQKEQKKNSIFIIISFSFFVSFYFIHLIVVVTSGYINSSTSVDLLQRHKQNFASSDRAYHSADTIDEALRTPWASHYEIKRGPATPNLPSNSSDSTYFKLVFFSSHKIMNI
jgi:hypothetical protein